MTSPLPPVARWHSWVGRTSLGATAARFSLVGVANTAVDVVVYLLLTSVGLSVVLANFISTSCGMTFSFFANRSFTFRRAKGMVGRQLILFLLVTVTGQWILQPTIITASSRLLPLLDSGPLATLIPKLLGIGTTVVWNFILYRLVVFRGSDSPAPEDTQPPLPSSGRPEPPR